MNEQDMDLVFDLALGRISEEEFLHRFPENPRTDPSSVRRYLASAIQAQDGDSLEAALILAKRFGYPDDYARILSGLLCEPWHHSHEEFASDLQKLKDPRTVEALSAAVETTFPYLDCDEFYAFGVKCIWALAAIGTPAAIARLQALTHSANPILRENAIERLAELRGKTS